MPQNYPYFLTHSRIKYRKNCNLTKSSHRFNVKLTLPETTVNKEHKENKPKNHVEMIKKLQGNLILILLLLRHTSKFCAP